MFCYKSGLRFFVVMLIVLCGPVSAHFQVLEPSDDVVRGQNNVVHLELVFTHPMNCGPAMDMGVPDAFGVVVGGKRHNLKPELKQKKVQGATAYECEYHIKRPGDYIFYVEPEPYWEPAEGKMIVHYTKVVVDAYGAETGWDRMVGMPVEIEPLVRPYGLWTGNVFRGIVKHHGKPVPYAEIEVEYYNKEQSIRVPSGPYVTQVIRADSNGVFSYAMPAAGWWGFAALVEGGEKMKNPNGTKVPVELGALMWIRTRDMKVSK